MRHGYNFLIFLVFFTLIARHVSSEPWNFPAAKPAGATIDRGEILYHAQDSPRVRAQAFSEASQVPPFSVVPGPLTQMADFYQNGDFILVSEINQRISIPPGEHLVLKFDPVGRSISFLLPPFQFSQIVENAIERCPRWLRLDMRDNLYQMREFPYLLDAIAEFILNAQDPYVDESCFLVAHMSPDLFVNGRLGNDFQLLHENIHGIYNADAYLDYVQVIDHGNSLNDDYWTTLEYRIRTEAGDTVDVTIDRDIYYWFVLHPRISDEIPSFINPATGRSASPPQGKFWRDYYLNEPDEGYTSLGEFMQDCDIMYGNLFNNNTDENGAIGRVTRWVRSCMTFDSGAERPIQPVRIYTLHMGRCGEYQDITAAAARAALIPVVCTSSITEDHVWDEFWDGSRWKTWEPVNNYIGDSLAYQGWGKRFPALFDWRGDGFVWTVTRRYHSRTTDLTVEVLDADNQPVDGARVKLMGDYLYGGIQFATAGYTDCTGRVTFPIGGSRNIYAAISSDLGSFPADQNAGELIIENGDVDSVYFWQYVLEESNPLPTAAYEPSPPPLAPDYRIEMSVDLLNEATHGEITHGGIFNQSDFVADVGTGDLTVYLCDSLNYTIYESGGIFQPSAMQHFDQTGSLTCDFSDTQPVYAILDNAGAVSDYQRIDVTGALYFAEELAVEQGSQQHPEAFSLYPAYPNPFNPSTTLHFSLKETGITRVSIYNTAGQLVKELHLGKLSPGTHQLNLDMDKFSAGIYFCHLVSGDDQQTRKLTLLK